MIYDIFLGDDWLSEVTLPIWQVWHCDAFNASIVVSTQKLHADRFMFCTYACGFCESHVSGIWSFDEVEQHLAPILRISYRISILGQLARAPRRRLRFVRKLRTEESARWWQLRGGRGCFGRGSGWWWLRRRLTSSAQGKDLEAAGGCEGHGSNLAGFQYFEFLRRQKSHHRKPKTKTSKIL